MTDMAETRVSVPVRYIAAVVVGNALEFYDFTTYTFFAIQIGQAFFPKSSPDAQALNAFLTFFRKQISRPFAKGKSRASADRSDEAIGRPSREWRYFGRLRESRLILGGAQQ